MGTVLRVLVALLVLSAAAIKVMGMTKEDLQNLGSLVQSVYRTLPREIEVATNRLLKEKGATIAMGDLDVTLVVGHPQPQGSRHPSLADGSRDGTSTSSTKQTDSFSIHHVETIFSLGSDPEGCIIQFPKTSASNGSRFVVGALSMLGGIVLGSLGGLAFYSWKVTWGIKSKPLADSTTLRYPHSDPLSVFRFSELTSEVASEIEKVDQAE